MKRKAKIWCLAISLLMFFLTIGSSVADDRIIGTWPDDDQPLTFYADPTTTHKGSIFWTVPNGDTPSGDIAAGDILGASDGEVDDLVSCWRTGLWIYNKANNSWKEVFPQAPKRVAVGDLGWDEKLEIIGAYGNGIFFFYLDGTDWSWRQITNYVPIGDIAAGDIDGDGLDEVVAGFSSGTWYWNPADDQWKKITAYNAYNLAVGDMNGDGLAEVAGSFPSGIWSWDRGRWSRLTGSGFATNGDIAFGDFDGNGKDDLVSCWPHWRYDWSGLLWVLWDSGKWEKQTEAAYRVTTGKMWSGD